MASRFKPVSLSQELQSERPCASARRRWRHLDGRRWQCSEHLERPRTLAPGPRFNACHRVGVRRCSATPTGAIWVGTSAGLVWLRDGKETRFTTENGLGDNWVYCLAAGREGTIWVGTRDGFSRVRNDQIETFRASDGLSQSTVFALCEDREGSLWVGTKHGLNQFLDRRLTMPFTDQRRTSQQRRGADRSGPRGYDLGRHDRRWPEPL